MVQTCCERRSQCTRRGGAVHHVLAENIVALVFIPKLPPKEDETGGLLAPNYSYDSTVNKPDEPNINPKNQLPPVVGVVMVAIDEESAAKLAAKGVTDLGVKDLFRRTPLQN